MITTYVRVSLRRSEVESRLCVPGRLLRGSVGQGVPTQPGGDERGEGESVGRVIQSGHPSRVTRRGQWPRGSVGRAPLLAAERAWRVGRSENTRLNLRSHNTRKDQRFYSACYGVA